MAKVSLTRECDITGELKRMSENLAKDYTSTQGCTVKKGGDKNHHFVIVHQKNTVGNKSGILYYHNASDVSFNGGLSMGHANDCTYYKDRVYVVQGGGDEKSTEIKSYTMGLSLDKTYQYVNPDGELAFDDISSIAHVKDGYFILGKRNEYVTCVIDGNTFRQVNKSFKLSENELSRSGCEKLAQGICFTNGKVYKAFSYRLPKDPWGMTDKILDNDIAVYNVGDVSQSVPDSAVKPSTIYHYNWDNSKPDARKLKKLEIESICSTEDGSEFYVSTNEEEWVETGKTGPRDSVYRAKFSG